MPPPSAPRPVTAAVFFFKFHINDYCTDNSRSHSDVERQRGKERAIKRVLIEIVSTGNFVLSVQRMSQRKTVNFRFPKEAYFTDLSLSQGNKCIFKVNPSSMSRHKLFTFIYLFFSSFNFPLTNLPQF